MDSRNGQRDYVVRARLKRWPRGTQRDIRKEWHLMDNVESECRRVTRKDEAMLPFPTTDARQWAAEFVRLHGGDEGLMLGWFANAIEHGHGPDALPEPPASGDADAAWDDFWFDEAFDMVPVNLRTVAFRHHRPRIEAAIRAEAAGPSYAAVRKAVSDSYYDSRYEGATMEVAADLAATRVLNLWSQARAAEYARLTEDAG